MARSYDRVCMEIKSIKQLEDALQYYVIDAEVCLERHYTFNQVVIALKKEIQTIKIDVFTDNNIIRDINLIQQLTINL